MLEDLIVAATNEALRKVEEESTAVMSKLTGGLGGLRRRTSFLMESYYSRHINKLIEQLSHLPGIGAKSAQRLAFHIMNMPKEQVEEASSSITDARGKMSVTARTAVL